jgi:hypothetical protein
MRICALLLAALVLAGGVASAQDFSALPAPANVGAGFRPVREQRGFYDAIRMRSGRASVCHGQRPTHVRTTRTGGDIAAAIFTLGLWTPAHLYVRC